MEMLTSGMDPSLQYIPQLTTHLSSLHVGSPGNPYGMGPSGHGHGHHHHHHHHHSAYQATALYTASQSAAAVMPAALSLWPPNPIHLLAPPHHPTSPSLTVRHSHSFLFCSPHYLSFLKLGAMWVKAEWRTTPNCWIPKETHWNVWQQLSESGAGCHRRRL